MVNLLRLQGVEVHRATKEFSVKDQKYPAGSYIVRMDQPYSRMADMLLDTQYYNVSDPAPYDDTGWTMGAMRNVKTVRVVDKSVLDAPMTLLTADAKSYRPTVRSCFRRRLRHQSQHRQHARDASLQVERREDERRGRFVQDWRSAVQHRLVHHEEDGNPSDLRRGWSRLSLSLV
jgi:hypothetical protein